MCKPWKRVAHLLTASLMAALPLSMAAVGPETNLLADIEFRETAPSTAGVAAAWQAEPPGAWQRGEIVSFQGRPDTLHYIGMDGSGGRVSQGMLSVETNTWYVLHAWYRGKIKPDRDGRSGFFLYAVPSSPADGTPPELKSRYGQAGRESDTIQPADAILTPYGGVLHGSIDDWIRVRALAFSGTNRVFTICAGFQGVGECFIGNCDLQKLSEDDFLDARVTDGALEDGVVGLSPAAFISKPGTARAIVTDQGTAFRVGSRKMLVCLRPKGDPVYLYAPQSVPVRPGEQVRVTFWAKTSAARDQDQDKPVILTAYALRQKDWWRVSQSAELKSTWERVTQELVVPGRSEPSFVEGPQLLDFHIEAAGPARAVWIDDYTIEIRLPDSGGKKSVPTCWQPSGKNLIMNPSCEAGLQGWSARFQTFNPLSGAASIGAAAIDTQTVHSGRCSLRLDITDLGSQTNQAFLNSACFPVEADTNYVLTFWARADRPVAMSLNLLYHPCRLAADTFHLTNEWRRFTCAFKVLRMLPAYRKFLSMEFHFKQAGTYWLDDFQVEQAAASTPYEPGERIEVGADATRLYPWYRQGERAEGRLYVASHLPQAETADLKISARDWKGRILSTTNRPLAVPAGETLIEPIALYRERLGVFLLELAVTGKQSGATAQAAMVYGIFSEPNRDLAPEQLYFGVHNFLSGRNNDGLLPGGSIDQYYGQIAALGILWERNFDLGTWGRIEPQAGQWVWQDVMLESARKHGIRFLVVLGFDLRRSCIPVWAESDSPTEEAKRKSERRLIDFYPRLDAWTNFVDQVVAHYGDRVDAYEMLNESGWFSAEKYVEFTRATREVFRQSKTPARLIGPAFPSHGLPWDDQDDSWIGQVFKQGVYDQFDVISAHFYPPGDRGAKCLETFVSPRGSAETQLAIRARYLRGTYGAKPLWNTEYALVFQNQVPWMYSPSIAREFESGRKYATARTQAERFLRWNIMLMSIGVERSFWHTFAHTSLRQQSYQAMVEPNYAPKPVLGAMVQAARRLQPAGFKKKAAIGATTWFYLFDAGGKPVVVYWDFDREGRDGRLVLENADNPQLVIEDMMGNPVVLPSAGRRLALPLGTDPYYVMSAAMGGEALLNLLASGRVEQ